MQPPARDERETSRRAGEGFTGLWQVATRYEIVDGVLREDGEGARLYFPAAYPDLAPALAKVREGDEDAVVDFARTWGTLGYWALELRHDRSQRVGGDPLDWVWAHANGVRVCLELVHHLSRAQNGESQDLGPYLQSLRGPLTPTSKDHDWWPAVTYGARDRIRLCNSLHSEGSLAGIAAGILRRIINDNLAGISPYLAVVPDEDGERRPDLMVRNRFTALCDVVYWHVADMAVGNLSISKCEECGLYFTQTDRRQRFCPPAPWERGEREGAHKGGKRAESRCGRRSRMRAARSRVPVSRHPSG